MAAMFFTAFIAVLGGSLTLLFTAIGFHGLFSGNNRNEHADGFVAICVAIVLAVATRWLVT